MKQSSEMALCQFGYEDPKRCLSCGIELHAARRRYCSVSCRQHLRHQLDIRTGLLKALNTEFATFYFTDALLVMDVLTYGAHEIFSFIYRRSPRCKPVDDCIRMFNNLGNVWWSERRRTHKRYLASLQVLRQARRNNGDKSAIRPLEVKQPILIGKSLIHLKLSKADLQSPKLEKIIKNAYRRQAKKHHPDQGGDAATFRRIHQAYQTMIEWAENPVFVRRRGFPDKWFYEGRRNKWVQPAPYPASGSR